MRSLLFFISTLAIAGDFSTSLGDSYPYNISAITTDSAGNTYVVGSRALGGGTILYGGIFDPASIVPGYGFQNFLYGGSDVFVSKLDPNGKLLFTDTFAGKGIDTGTAIALDPSGNIYIAGTTTSPDFPLSKALQTTPNTNGTGFVMKLTNDGSTILYSTYLGGTRGGTSITALATDSKGNLYLTGNTTSIDFPHTPGMPFGPNPLPSFSGRNDPANSGVIMAAISAAGDKLLYSGALVGGPIPIPGGGIAPTISSGIAADAAGNAYIAGNFGGGTALPTTPGVLGASGSFSGFLAKVNATGTGLSYLTYLPHLVSAVAVDPVGDAYLAGFDFDAPPGAPVNPYVAKINPTASAIVWTNNLGGLADTAHSIAVDANGNVWATGTTSSSTFPNSNGWTTGPEFLVGINSSGSQISHSARYPGGTIAQSIAIDPAGLVHVAGLNGFVSAIAPNTAPTMRIFGLQNGFGGNLTARISPGEVISIYGPALVTPAPPPPVVNGFYPKTYSGVQVTLNGVNLPILYVGKNQINAVVPMGLLAPPASTLRVINGSQVSPDYPVRMVDAAPLAFPTVINQDGTINSQTDPAKGGTTFSFYATGWQSNFGQLADGQVATAALDTCLGTCQVSPLGNVYAPAAKVTYGGTAPGIVAGVSQINVQIAPIPTFHSTFQFNFILFGPASLTQSVWVTP